MNRDEFVFLPVLKLTVSGNNRPALHQVDDAMRRRINMAPFSHKPANVDRELEEKLRPEWPAILRWMMDGCADWRRDGLVRPASVLDATEEYFEAQDAFGHWLEQDCVVEPGNSHRWES